MIALNDLYGINSIKGIASLEQCFANQHSSDKNQMKK